jgi:ABC-type multidrug transport system permease subunit
VSKNQSQAMQLAVFYIMPTFVLSGAFTPIETQPERVRPVAFVVLTFGLSVLLLRIRPDAR